MPRNDDLVRLYHIWEAATEAIGYARGRHQDELTTDRPFQHSLVRLLEIIGEAAGKVSDTFRHDHQDIPWQVMIGMRNRIAHAYFDIHLGIVWQTVTENLPALVQRIQPILEDEGLLHSR